MPGTHHRITELSTIRSCLRWIIPSSVTLVFLILLGHKSSIPLFLSRYSARQMMLMGGTGFLAWICWQTAFDADRYRQFSARTSRFPFLSALIISACALILFDVVYGLEGKNFFSDMFYTCFPIISGLPLICAALVWILSTPSLSEALKHLSVLMVSLLVGLWMAEGLFRFVVLQSDVPETSQQFEALIASAWPRSISPDKHPGVFRILGLSDSFGEIGGQHNYHYLLERQLQEGGKAIELVNLSRRGYDPPDQLLVFQRFGRQYQPDLVLHGVFVGNDLVSNEVVHTQGTLLSYQNIAVRYPKGLSAYRPANFLLFQWGKRYFEAIHDRKMRQQESRILGFPGTFSLENFLRIERDRLEVCRRRNASAITGQWQELVGVLDKLKKEVEDTGATYLMVIHPDQLQVEIQLRAQLEQKYELNLEDYDFSLPQTFLQQYCAERRIPCLDLLLAFRAQGAYGGLYLPQDTHYNESGNVLAAQMIRAFVERSKDFGLQRE